MRYKPDLFASKDITAQGETENEEEEKKEKNATIMTRMFEGKSDCYKYAVMFVFMAMVCVQIAEAQIMPKSVQHNLTPSDRSAQILYFCF